MLRLFRVSVVVVADVDALVPMIYCGSSDLIAFLACTTVLKVSKHV